MRFDHVDMGADRRRPVGDECLDPGGGPLDEALVRQRHGPDAPLGHAVSRSGGISLWTESSALSRWACVSTPLGSTTFPAQSSTVSPSAASTTPTCTMVPDAGSIATSSRRPVGEDTSRAGRAVGSPVIGRPGRSIHGYCGSGEGGHGPRHADTARTPADGLHRRAGSRTMGQAIRSRRLEQGLTMAQLAERADLSQPFLSKVERGLGRLSMSAIDRVAKALGTSAVGLFAGSEPPAPIDVVRRDERLRIDAYDHGEGIGQALTRRSGQLRVMEFVGGPEEFARHAVRASQRFGLRGAQRGVRVRVRRHRRRAARRRQRVGRRRRRPPLPGGREAGADAADPRQRGRRRRSRDRRPSGSPRRDAEPRHRNGFVTFRTSTRYSSVEYSRRRIERRPASRGSP